MATHWTGLPEGDGDKLKACGAASACEVSQPAGRWLMSVGVLSEWGPLPLGLTRGLRGGVQRLGGSVLVDQEGGETWPTFVSRDFSDLIGRNEPLMSYMATYIWVTLGGRGILPFLKAEKEA